MKRWPTTPLADAYWFQEGPGVRKWQFRNSGVKLLNVGNITKEGTLDLSKTNRHLSSDEVAEKYSHFLIDDGDLVIASSGISFDEDGLLRTRGVFVEKQHLPLCLNTSTIRFKAKAGVSSLAWLRYWLDSIEFRGQITRLVTGAAQQNFGPSHLKATKISLPPLAEQERLVTLLDDAAELRKLRAQANGRTAALVPSLFNQMFGDPDRNPKRWKKIKLGELCDLINGAPFKPSDWDGSGLPIIRIQNLNDPAKPFNYTSKKLEEKFRVRSGDTLLSWSGTPGTSFGCFNWNGPEGWLNQHIFNVKLKASLDGEFFIQSVNVRLSELIAKAHGGVGLQHVTKGTLNGVDMLVPPLELQKEFAARVTEIRTVQAEQAASRRRLDSLFQSMLHSAFSGQL